MLPDVCIDLREHEQTKTGWNDGTLHPLRASGAGGVCDGEYETPQWWDIVTEEKNAILDGTDIEPIVWVIDNFARNHRLGLIYEAKVDNGSVLFCQPDLLHKDEIAAKWLFYSLYQYAASERFVPAQTMEPGQIEKMYG